MTKEETNEMAIQAGFPTDYNGNNLLHAKEIEIFAKMVAQKEREECAKIIDDSYTTTKAGEGISEDWLLTLSELIRARRQDA